jgi:hypothetical protein
MVEAAGYECACSTLRGNSHEAGERFRLARVRMHGERVGLKLRYTATRVYYWLNRSRREKDRLKFAAEDKF